MIKRSTDTAPSSSSAATARKKNGEEIDDMIMMTMVVIPVISSFRSGHTLPCLSPSLVSPSSPPSLSQRPMCDSQNSSVSKGWILIK